jgi:hypothetical protein
MSEAETSTLEGSQKNLLSFSIPGEIKVLGLGE